MVSFEEFVRLYSDEFLPAYSDLVGFIADKPSNMLLDIENTFSHLMVYFFMRDSSQISQENLDKAYNHLIRLTLDCDKLLWASMDKTINELMGDEAKRKFVVTLHEDELIRRFRDYKVSAQHARTIENANIGINPLLAIREYQHTTELAMSIIDNIDEMKTQYFEKHRYRYWLKTQCTGILIGGIIGTILSTIVLKFVLHWV